jgi:pyruvate formate lyase activating enzyme
MGAAREAGIANVLVTNGCAGAEASAEILALCDAVNVDLKSFSPKTYRDVLGGDLDAVKSFIRAAAETGVHAEITTLVVPGLNDSEKELDGIAVFIAEIKLQGISAPDGTALSPPWHLSAYHPDWHCSAAPTDAAFLRSAAERAKQMLPFVYTGNIGGEADTFCAHCGAALVKRRGYRTDTTGLTALDGVRRCAQCGKPAPFAG